MSHPFPKVSVVIPVKNEGLKIRSCIEGLLSQSVPVHEIIAVDSGSTDDTLAILNSYPIVRVAQIPPSEFNHGLTRNFGVSMASGEYVFLTVGDARPVDYSLIGELLRGFMDEDVAAVCGQQVVPHEKDKNPVDWFRPRDLPTITRYSLTPSEFEALEPVKKRQICAWDDVCAMYRRKDLMEIPFRSATYAEDVIWAKDAIVSGRAIAYVKSARVFHYHHENHEFTFKRTLTSCYFLYKHFNYIPEKPSTSFVDFLRLVKTIWISDKTGFFDHFKWLHYNLSQRRSFRQAIEVFTQALEKGDDELEAVYSKYCKSIPIPLKRMN